MKTILSIESSCDETSLSLIITPEFIKKDNFVEYLNSYKVLYQIVSSQINIHAGYGGVIPEIGARHHANSIHILFDKMLFESVNRIKSLSKGSVLEGKDNNNLNEQLIVKTVQPDLDISFKSINKELLIKNNISLNDLLKNKKLILKSLDSIMVTTNPGLTSSLKVGVEFAKTIKFFVKQAYGIDVKIEDINHLNGHVASSFYKIS